MHSAESVPAARSVRAVHSGPNTIRISSANGPSPPKPSTSTELLLTVAAQRQRQRLREQQLQQQQMQRAQQLHHQQQLQQMYRRNVAAMWQPQHGHWSQRGYPSSMAMGPPRATPNGFYGGGSLESKLRHELAGDAQKIRARQLAERQRLDD